MSELKVITYTQECDLCHKVLETDKYGLDEVTIPYAMGDQSSTVLLRFNVCPCCRKRLGCIMSHYLDTDRVFGWKDFSANWKEDAIE